MANKTFGKRAKLAWKALSVQALALAASAPAWYPHVAPHLSLDASQQGVITSVIAVAGIFGWMKPQPKLDKALDNG